MRCDYEEEVLIPAKLISDRGFINYFLTANVGGTKTDMGICGQTASGIQLIFKHRYESSKITDFRKIINDTLHIASIDFDIETDSAAIAAAGLVTDDRSRIKLTNLKCDIDANYIIKNSLLRRVLLLNDFEAVAYGVAASIEENRQFRIIKRGYADPYAAIGVIGAGTGLGMSILHYNPESKKYKAIPSEGGHMDAAAKTDEEWELIRYVKKRISKKHPGYERLVSGPGIINIYQFLRTQRRTKHDRKIMKAEDIAAAITTHSSDDANAKNAIRLFTQFYAQASRNLALVGLTTGGVYIAGGMIRKMHSVIDKKLFAKTFSKNDKQGKVLKNIPVYEVSDKNMELIGAAYYLI